MERPITRRTFVLQSLALSGSLLTLSITGCGGEDVSTPTGVVLLPADPSSSTFTIDLADARYVALKQVGGAAKVVVNKQGLIVTHVDASTYRAFSSSCTHEGCQLSLPKNGVITCPCHGAKFDLTGKVLKGPARRDQPQADVVLSGNILSITP